MYVNRNGFVLCSPLRQLGSTPGGDEGVGRVEGGDHHLRSCGSGVDGNVSSLRMLSWGSFSGRGTVAATIPIQ